MEGRLSGGWPAIMERNSALALAARRVLCEVLEIEPPCPDRLIGSLASVPIQDAEEGKPPSSPLYADPLQELLRRRYRIEVPVIPWPAPPKRLLRISAQLYNSLPQYELLADALKKILRARR
jgi:isopenicillin-N epimerase